MILNIQLQQLVSSILVGSKTQDSKVMANRLGISQGDHVLGANMRECIAATIGISNDSVPLAPFTKTPL